MRWLLLKDLQILRRSPLQVVLLIGYPILIAVLVGFAISRGPSEPKVALYNGLPPGTSIGFGSDQIKGAQLHHELCSQVECLDADSLADAKQKVSSGEATAALVLPPSLADAISSLASLNPSQPKIKVVVDESDPVKARVVDDRISSLLGRANLLIASKVAQAGGEYLKLILDGGEVNVFGSDFHVLGLTKAERELKQLRSSVPAGPDRDRLDEVARFAGIARQNLNFAGPILNAVAEPIAVDKVRVGGSSPPLDTFAVAVAATFTLMFVTVLLVAGSLALEREENAFARLAGLLGRSRILAAKIGLGTVIGVIVTVVMLLGLWLFIPLDWSRFGLWLAAIVLGAAAFAAAGATLGAATKEVRAASLLAFMICLPVALLSLVPDGSVGGLLDDVITAVTAIFPFKPALDSLGAALESSGADLLGPMVHLAILAVAYGTLARFALRRF